MPLRLFPFPLASRQLWPRILERSFHSSAVRRDGSTEQNYYEILQVPTNASSSDVKKSFYALSKTHHPDRNPEDPEASSRFVQISNAYATLGNPEKRSAYDRSLPRSHPHHHNHNRPGGSYHSSSPAGGRSPSGLSRRKTQFRGPPPSFYRSGGWGNHSAKRKAAQENGAPGAETPPETDNASRAGGMGPGQSPFGEDGMNDVPHFDREGHFRTQENQQQRWQRRRGSDEDYVPSGDVPRSALANFLFVGGIISLGVFLPGLLFERFSTKRGKRE